MSDDRAASAREFLELHRPGTPLLMANAWDLGSARLLAAAGFRALATTSSGLAASVGRLDYGISREDALAHAAVLCEGVDVPVSADLEDCYPEEPGSVAETVARARAAGLAGCSIEDWDPIAERIRSLEDAAERVAVAVAAAHDNEVRLVLTARAENHLHGNPDPDDTIARLRAYQEAGADVLYAPGLDATEELRRLIAAVELPVNVLIRASTPAIPELAALGVARVSVGGAFAFAAYAAAVCAGRELLEQGTHGYTADSAEGMRLVREALGPGD
jgi:2-methylisocitrate lyase-like PEP mutase family enzyme